MKVFAFASIVLTLGPSAVLGALHQKMSAKNGRYYGTCADPNTLNVGQVSNIIRAEFGQLTPENSMKWDATEPNRGQFNFGNADNFMNFATSNGKKVRGHTLVWHSQLPGWVNGIGDRNTLTSVIENHIQQVAGRWAGKIYAWDVVNEVFEENGSFRNSVFYRVLGEQFIDIAFKKARQVDPNAKLYINDYNLDGPGAKIDAVLSLVQRLRNRGVPIDGIGTQAHLILGQVGGVQAQLARMGATGLECAITELDIRIPKNVDNNKLNQQQNDYNTVTRACLSVSNCVGITVWGVSDRNSWVDSTFPSFDSPLLYDDNYNQKPAYRGVDSALN